MEGIDKIEVDIGEGIVSVEAAEDTRGAVTAKLLKLGYPESGTAEGIAAARAKAKSFVSCAVGRISGEE
jgi:copper chaperone